MARRAKKIVVNPENVVDPEIQKAAETAIENGMYHFLFKLCGEEHREQVRAVMKEYGIVWTELPPNKFVCIGDPKYMLDRRLHEFGMSQDWTNMA